MGAVYNEEEELDFTFLQQSVRQQTKGAAAPRRVDPKRRDRMADLVSERPPGNAYAARRQSRSAAASGRAPVRGAQGQNRGRQVTQAAGQARSKSAKRPPTMQEKQAALQARKKRRLRRQKQTLAFLLGILLLGSLVAVRKLQREQRDPLAEAGGQNVTLVQADRGDGDGAAGTVQGIPEDQYNRHPEWTEDFLTVSEYSRPGEPLEQVNNIFVHYTANINTSAANNRNYFENLKDNHDVPGASVHFIIGIEGEILQIVPLDEVAYGVKTRNQDSVSIECCYKYENGQFTQETYDSLIRLLTWLTDTYDLEPEDILRHYDCGGKKCPLYYVEHEDAWKILKQDVEKQLLLLQ